MILPPLVFPGTANDNGINVGDVSEAKELSPLLRRADVVLDGDHQVVDRLAGLVLFRVCGLVEDLGTKM